MSKLCNRQQELPTVQAQRVSTGGRVAVVVGAQSSQYPRKTLITKVEGSPFTFFDRNCRIPKAATTTQKATTTTQSALPTCVATEGFANGGFDISGGWSYEQPGSSYIPNKQLGATGAYENSADGWVLLLNFYLEEEYRTTVRDTKDAAIVTSFESEVKMCPGVQYNTDFRVRQARGDMSCTLNISLGEKQIFELDDFSEDWTNSGSISVPVVKAGQKGVRQSSTSSDLYVKFRGTMTCIPGYKKKGESGHWHVRAFFDTFLLDSFTIEPVQN
jgi:hypothetical protein